MQLETIETQAVTETRAAFTIAARPLSDAVKLLSGKVTDKRVTVPILAALLIDVAPCGLVTVTATDLDLQASIELRADAGETLEPGQVCVDAKALADALAKACKASDRVRLTVERPEHGAFDGSSRGTPLPYRVNVKAGRGDWTLRGAKPDEFPLFHLLAGDCSGEFGAAQLLADLKALAPAVSTKEARYYLNGYAMQVRELGGANRFAIVATDGHVIGAASRPIPAGLESWQDAILPRKTGAFMLAAAKLASDAVTVTLSRSGSKVAATLGPVSIVSKLIDGDFPHWQTAFERIAAPTGEIDAPLFPELLPGAPVGDMEKLAKAAPGVVAWENGTGGFIGTVATDPGFALACVRGDLSNTGRNGFHHRVGGHDDAAAYLKAIAEGLGLPSDAEMQARVDAINAAWGEPDCASFNEKRAHGKAALAGDNVDYRLPMQRGGLIERGGRVLGYTVGAFNVSKRWTETRQNWETLANDVIQHPETIEPVEGSYSVLMPAHGPQLAVMPDHYIDASDGHRYPIADNGSKIHLSADQVRALIGDSVWTVLEFPGADGKPRYVSQWLWDDGATRLLIVGKDGRCPKAGAVREYVTREQVEAALAGEIAAPVMIEAPAPISAECAPVELSDDSGQLASAPETAPACVAEPMPATHAAETAKSAPIVAPAEAEAVIDADACPIAAVRARLAEIEALLATLPAQSAAPAKRTPAHERAIRRAWAERKAARAAMAAYNASGDNRRALRKERDDWEGRAVRMQSKRRRAVLKAREMQRGKWERNLAYRAEREIANKALGNELAAKDRAKLAEQEAAEALAAREAMRALLTATQARLAAAESENAQLWAEIEGLTAPVPALAA